MQTRRMAQRSLWFRPACSLVSGALFLALSGAAQAQFTRSHPQPSAPSETVGSKPASSSHSKPSESTEQKSDYGKTDRADKRQVGLGKTSSRRGKPDFAVLFPAKSGAIAGMPTGYGLPVPSLPDGDIFAGVVLPKSRTTPAPSSGTGASAPLGERTTATAGASLARYKKSQEASAADPSHNPTGSSQILWPYDYLSPFFGYGPGTVIWWPREVRCSAPDASVFLPGPNDGVILGWPNYDPESESPRDDSTPSYRIGEKTKRRRPVDIQPALDDTQRAFLEEQPALLASHIRREASLVMSMPGETRRTVKSDLLLDRLAALFAIRHTIQLQFESPQSPMGDIYRVAAWYTYRDLAATTYRVKLRFVLQPQGDRLILTAFEID